MVRDSGLCCQYITTNRRGSLWGSRANRERVCRRRTPGCGPSRAALDSCRGSCLRQSSQRGRGFGCVWLSDGDRIGCGEVEEPRQVFAWILALNRNDNQGVRFLLSDLDEGLSWEEEWEKGQVEAFQLARIWGSQPDDVNH